jgi:hypothetical protein
MANRPKACAAAGVRVSRDEGQSLAKPTFTGFGRLLNSRPPFISPKKAVGQIGAVHSLAWRSC